MANAVRRIGRRGYIIFGIDENKRQIVDQSQVSVYPAAGDLSVDKRMDINEGHLIDCLRAYVTPTIDVSLGYGEVQGLENPESYARASNPEAIDASPSPNRGTIAWLEFRRMPPSPAADHPYTVKKGFQYEITRENGSREAKTLKPDSAWTRVGASNQDELRPDRHGILVSVSQIPWIDNLSWLNLARRPDMPKPNFYAPVDGVYGDLDQTEDVIETRERKDALSLLREWLNDGTASNLYLHGSVGAGKTTLLRVFDSVVRKELEAKNAELALISDEPPTTSIPVFVSLHGQDFGDAASVADFVLEQANITGDLSAIYDATNSTPEWRRRLLDSPGHHFVVMLDGLDEMEDDGYSWSKSLRSIKRFCDAHRGRVRVILSGRSGTPLWSGSTEGWRQLRLLALTDVHVHASASKLDYADRVWEVVEGAQELRDHLAIPLVMDYVFDFCREIEWTAERNGEMPFFELGRLVHEAVQAVLVHESRKDMRLHRDEARAHRSSSLATLAWRLDGAVNDAPLTVIESILGEGEVYRAEQMGIIAKGRAHDTWCFSTLVVKSYFVARYAVGLARVALIDPGAVDWKSELDKLKRGAELWPLVSRMLISLSTEDEILELRRSMFFDVIGQTPPGSFITAQ